MALPEYIIDFVQLPLPPPRRQAGTHWGPAGGFAGFQGGVAFGLPADEAAGLVGEVVEGADEGVEALADMGGVEGLVFGCEGGGVAVAGFQTEAAFPCWLNIPEVFGVEALERVEEFEGMIIANVERGRKNSEPPTRILASANSARTMVLSWSRLRRMARA